jgi:catechol 2,3-dioxygenase-like lactoylglutathione lyase family enzyme
MEVGFMDLKLEAIVIPVTDVDRAKEFYLSLGFRLDADLTRSEGIRVVQLTPPGSECSIHVGTGLTTAEPGSTQGLHLVVSDIEAARSELIRRGAGVGEPFHFGTQGPLAGLAPENASYGTFASFGDPDGNGWLLQEVRTRAPGR